jgi:two-component system, response regulator PdtaR
VWRQSERERFSWEGEGSLRALPLPSSSLARVAARVLIAEDETIIRLDLKGMLEGAGFEVCAEARDGEEAVRLALESEPDIALLDVKMPRLDGIEAARKILDERPIPIVMVTAYGERELVARAVEAGVFGYLVKPFRETDLLPAIETARVRHDELRALRAEADSLAEALAARKAIERAKGILMQREGLSEDEAFGRLRKASQISGRPIKVVAEALIATLGPGSDSRK